MAGRLLAELRFRDGQTEQVTVQVDHRLDSLISGINRLTGSVSVLLSELVERDGARRGGEHGEEQTEDSSEEDEPEDSPVSEPQPPTKRTKTCRT